MSSTSSTELCIPLEIIHEFILQSSSSPSSLAAWCSVSRSLLSFAAPLLYRSVVIQASEDVIPFLENLLLARSSSPLRPSSSLVLPSLLGIERLEIFALPPQDDALPLFEDTTNPPLPSKDLVLAINWEAQSNMATFWVPSLLFLLRPHQYEELGTLEPLSLSGLPLDVYLRTTRLDTWQPYLGSLYDSMYSCVTRLQESMGFARAAGLAIEFDSPLSPEPNPLLESLVPKLDALRAWIMDTNLLDKTQDGTIDVDAVVAYMVVHDSKMEEAHDLFRAIVAEYERLTAEYRKSSATMRERANELQQVADEAQRKTDAMDAERAVDRSVVASQRDELALLGAQLKAARLGS